MWQGKDIVGKEKPYVQIIIPTYNRAKLLPEAIESVLEQGYPFKKIVIVDDGSTDDTADISKLYIKKYPEIITYIYKQNGGCSTARNRGLELINDDIGYVSFLDSDDCLLPELGDRVELLNQNPDADFCYSDSIIFEEGTQRETIRKVAAANRPENFSIEHFLTNEAKSAAVLYRAATVRFKRFREDLMFNEDSEFLQRIAIEHKGIYFPKPSCWVRSHPGSKSRNLIEINKAVLRSSLDILESYPDFYHTFSHLADERIKQIKKSLFVDLMLSMRWSEAEKYSGSFLEKILVACCIKSYSQFKRFVQRSHVAR